MSDGRVANVVRERGYEALFLLAGCVAVSLRPTMSGAIEVGDEIGDLLLKRRELKSLRDRGLIESGGRGAEKIMRLTETGVRSFAGGRDPEQEWGRAWDGQWRLIIFDLPRDAGSVRTKFWRWLRSCHFGRLQGSVWVGCDPVPEVGQAAREAGLDSSRVILFTGQVEGRKRPRDVVEEAWDFDGINGRYAGYIDFAGEVIKEAGSRTASRTVLKTVLKQDRTLWWKAVRSDPLLPESLLPRGYKGTLAWKRRQQLHRKLFRALDPEQL